MKIPPEIRTTIQAIEQELAQFKSELIAWLTQRNIKPKNFPNYYDALLLPCHEALATLSAPETDDQSVRKAIHSLHGYAGGAFRLLENMESEFDQRAPDALYHLKDSFFKNTILLKTWLENYSL